MEGVKIYFLVHAEPVHPLKGREVLFVVREQNKEKGIYRSHNVIKEIPHIILTRPLQHDAIDKLLLELGNNYEYKEKKIEFEKVPYSRDKSFIRAFCSKEDRKILPEYFICKDEEQKGDSLGLNSPSRLLRWLYPPFAKIASLDAIPDIEQALKHPFTEFASLEEIIKDKKAGIDIELENWEEDATEPQKIFMTILYSPERKVIVHDLPFDDKNFGEVELIRAENQEDLVRKFCEQEIALDLFLRVGHNNMAFDDLKLRDLPAKVTYFPSTVKHYPVTKAATKNLKKVLVKGRHTMDTYNYLFNNLRIKKNERLETHAGFKKSVTYEEQAGLVKLARKGSREAFESLLEYSIADGEASYSLYNNWIQNAVLKALVFKRDVNTVCATSKNSIAEEYWKKRHFISRGCFEDQWKTHYKREDSFHLDDFKNGYLLSGFREGLMQEVHVVYFTPFIRIFGDFLKKSEANAIYEKLKNEKDPDQKIDLAQTLNAFLTKPVKELLNIFRRYKIPFGKQEINLDHLANYLGEDSYMEMCRDDFSVGKKFGLLGRCQAENIVNFNNAFYETVKKANKGLENKEIVNVSRLFHYIKGDLNHLRLEGNLYGIYLGIGPVLSISRKRGTTRISELIGRTIANPYNISSHKGFVYQGIKISGGRKSRFESRIASKMIEDALTTGDCREIQQIFEQEFSKITIANKRDLLFQDVKKQESNLDDWWGYKGEKQVEDGQTLKAYFGFASGKKIPAKEFLKGEATPDFECYKMNFKRNFGSLLAAVETREKTASIIVWHYLTKRFK